jgi:hypothetical protein
MPWEVLQPTSTKRAKAARAQGRREFVFTDEENVRE